MIRTNQNSFSDAREKIVIARAARAVAQKLTRNRLHQPNVIENWHDFKLHRTRGPSARLRNRLGDIKLWARSGVQNALAVPAFKGHRISDPSLISRYRIDRRQTSVPKQEKFVNLVVEVPSNNGSSSPFSRLNSQQVGSRGFGARNRLNMSRSGFNSRLSSESRPVYAEQSVFQKAINIVERSRSEANEVIYDSDRDVEMAAVESENSPQQKFTAQKKRGGVAFARPSGIGDGFKIKIANLSSSVSEEDLEELLKSIGPISEARLLGAGKASAVFTRQQDAKKAISEFNSRELDGVPMRLSLVPATTQSMTGRAGQGRGAVAVKSRLRVGGHRPQGTSALPIDRDTVTHALFTGRRQDALQCGGSAVQFTVKI